jgi:hypothetical protein
VSLSCDAWLVNFAHSPFRRLDTQSYENLLEAISEFKRLLRDMQSLSKRPKELGYPWETGLAKDHITVDDGLNTPFVLPLDLCYTPQVKSQSPSTSISHLMVRW